MSKYLVIVESPAKAKTINKYLGKAYTVKASVGHVMDLPVSRLGVDTDRAFTPEYELIKGKKKVVDDITAAAKTCEKVFLAPDPDREGEAIAWHIAELIKKATQKKGASSPEIYRVLFNEITRKGVEAGMSHPGEVNSQKVEAQQARRILDRLVGYQISPLLWDKVKRNLSAGRVQSVAVRLICDRESEIAAFKAEEYWTVDVLLAGKIPPPFKARLASHTDKKLELHAGEETHSHLARLKKESFVLEDIEKKERQRKPYAPFITSTLQQEAARRLGFTAKKTMTLAQQLYEGVALEGDETTGLITYMRTDSTRLSEDATNEARTWISENVSADTLPAKTVVYTRKNATAAQDAHEAIRPTSAYRTPASLKGDLDRDLMRLYELIWKRFIACQMNPAVYDQTTFHIKAGPYGLRANGSILRFKGFLAIYEDNTSERDGEEASSDDRPLPDLAKGEILTAQDFFPEQHFTQPPPRYSEASLVKELEERGIGRPSTYASIISTIQEKKYAEKVESRFHPTELGKIVTVLLVEHFARVLDPQFTAGLESELDDIESGKRTSEETLAAFYATFKPTLEKAKIDMKNLKKQEIATELTCPKCSAPMVIKWGKNGEFIACTAYPECKTTGEFTRNADGSISLKEEEKVDETCEKCGSPMVAKRGRFGKFLACSAYPECKSTKPMKTGLKCPDCSNELAERKSKRGKAFWGCTKYPTCKFASWDKPVPKPCPTCGSAYLVEKTTKSGTAIRCPKKECDYHL